MRRFMPRFLRVTIYVLTLLSAQGAIPPEGQAAPPSRGGKGGKVNDPIVADVSRVGIRRGLQKDAAGSHNRPKALTVSEARRLEARARGLSYTFTSTRPEVLSEQWISEVYEELRKKGCIDDCAQNVLLRILTTTTDSRISLKTWADNAARMERQRPLLEDRSYVPVPGKPLRKRDPAIQIEYREGSVARPPQIDEGVIDANRFIKELELKLNAMTVIDANRFMEELELELNAMRKGVKSKAAQDDHAKKDHLRKWLESRW